MDEVARCGGLDRGQWVALHATAKKVHSAHEGFLLVQGPPGTGKSTLLLAILNLLHNAAHEAVHARVLGTGAETESRAVCSLDALLRCGRTLVCAHSNAAVDELVMRVLRQRPPFIDNRAAVYMPSIVRLGMSSAATADPVACSLDALVGTRRQAALERIERTRAELAQRATARVSAGGGVAAAPMLPPTAGQALRHLQERMHRQLKGLESEIVMRAETRWTKLREASQIVSRHSGRMMTEAAE